MAEHCTIESEDFYPYLKLTLAIWQLNSNFLGQVVEKCKGLTLFCNYSRWEMWFFVLFMPNLAFPGFAVMLLKVEAATSAILYWAFRFIICTHFILPGEKRFEGLFVLFSFPLSPCGLPVAVLSWGSPQPVSFHYRINISFVAKCRKQEEKLVSDNSAALRVLR